MTYVKTKYLPDYAKGLRVVRQFSTPQKPVYRIDVKNNQKQIGVDLSGPMVASNTSAALKILNDAMARAPGEWTQHPVTHKQLIKFLDAAAIVYD